MGFKLLRLRFRRRLRRSQQQVEGFGQQTEQTIEQHVFKRFARLAPVRRFVITWLLLLVLLISGVLTQTVLLNGYFQTYQPVAGGVYNEGVLGRFTTANPLFATSDVDTTVSRLLFSGLLTYDAHNRLTGDLATGYSVDSRGTTYTLHLRPGLKWQDGQPLTSADVAYTYQTIQNPDVQSPLQSSWAGVTITAVNPITVSFKLPTVLASFPYNLTNGIVPQHILAKVAPADLRSADFNTVHPIGSGPFMWQTLQVAGSDPATEQEQIALVPFANYHAGKPKLAEFIVRAYADKDDLTKAFLTNQLTAAEGFSQLPPELQHHKSLQQHSLLLTAATMVFFKTSSGILSDQSVRKALVAGTNIPAVIAGLSYQTRQVREPLLEGQLAYDASLMQSRFDPKTANSLLDQAGWARGKNGVRSKAGQQLQFSLTANDTPEYAKVTHTLQQQWRAIGANVQLQLQDPSNFQSTLQSHDYQALLNGIAIGVDPDVYVYWDSAQADVRAANRLNLSEYKNATVDDALEAGRTRLNPDLRVIKYKPFLQAWQQDAPAVGLYQPRLLYLTNGTVAGLGDQAINASADRFYNVQNWEIRQVRVTNH